MVSDEPQPIVSASDKQYRVLRGFNNKDGSNRREEGDIIAAGDVTFAQLYSLQRRGVIEEVTDDG